MAPNNPLSSWGNEKTMNLNTLILTNIQSSPYFKVQLFELKTFHEVVDEIYYKVDHLEPWEKGSRKTAGQTGMCGGVRGVGAGGIVSSAYCLLFKLFTLKLTKKQVNNLITHSDSPFIRGLGFMYIRYSQPPNDLWDWYEPYLDDEEELDVKAGGGHIMTVGEMLRQWLVKLEWYSTLFPRIPVPIQKELDVKLRSRPVTYGYSGYGQEEPVKEPQRIPDEEVSFGEAERSAQNQRGTGGKGSNGNEGFSNGNIARRSPPLKRRSPPRRSPHSRDDFSRDLERERDRQRREKEKERYKDRDEEKERHKDRDEEKERFKDRDEEKERYKDRDEEKERYKDRDEKRKSRSRSRSKDKRRDEKDNRREKDDKKEHKKEKKSHKHSKERSRDKDRERERDVLRERERSREGDRSKERRKEMKNRPRERDISKERERSRERDRSQKERDRKYS